MTDVRRWRETFGLGDEVPELPVELLEWPDPPPVLPVRPFRLPPEREVALRGLLPAPATTAWATARELTAWVSERWSHANDHVDRYDAVDILERARGGARFACDEYTVVLSQALNAVGIPARWLGLFRRDHHAGHSAAHSVTEAWIDELRRWVVLDGQNAAYWAGSGGEPLGVIELQRAFHEDDRRPTLVLVTGTTHAHAEGDFWWQYFAIAQTTGVTAPPSSDLAWGSPSAEARTYGPVFQGRFLLGTDRLMRNASHAYPDLSAVWVGVAGTADRPALTFGTHHPYPRGFAVGDDPVRVEVGPSASWRLDLSPGVHEAPIRLVTAYAEIPAGRVRYRVP